MSVESRELARRSAVGGLQRLFDGEAVVAARCARGFQETQPGPSRDGRRRDSEELRHLAPGEEPGAAGRTGTSRGSVTTAAGRFRMISGTVAIAAACLRPTPRTVPMFHHSPETASAESPERDMTRVIARGLFALFYSFDPFRPFSASEAELVAGKRDWNDVNGSNLPGVGAGSRSYESLGYDQKRVSCRARLTGLVPGRP